MYLTGLISIIYSVSLYWFRYLEEVVVQSVDNMCRG